MKFKIIILFFLTMSVISCKKSGGNNADASVDNSPSSTPPPINLSVDQMQEVLNDSAFALDNLYAHFKLDVSTGLPNDPMHIFAKSPHAVDSISTTSTPDVFMRNIENAFEQQHDGHTQIIYPKPYSCYAAGILPNTLSLKYAYDANNTPYVSVSLAQPHPYSDLSMGALYDNQINLLAGGTVITQINGVNISDILTQTGGATSLADFNHVADIGNGANSDAQISEGLNFLFFRPGELTQLPAGTNADPTAASTFTITYETVDAWNNTVNLNPKTVTLPWIMWHNSSCLDQNQSESLKFGTINDENPLKDLKGNRLHDNYYYNTFTNPLLNKNVDKNLEKDAQPPTATNYNTIDGIEGAPIYTLVSSYTHGKKNFLYMKIPTFEPSNKNKDNIDSLMNIIFLNLQNYINPLIAANSINGIVVDVRDNGGGYVAYGDAMAKFLSHQSSSFYPMYFRLLTTQNNFDFITYLANQDSSYASMKNSMALSLSEHIPYTTAAPITYPYKQLNSNTLPISVLTNANCFSSCDAFTAMMKDNHLATIVSETAHTGGGGATVLTWNSLAQNSVSINNNQFFHDMPNNMNMRFAWSEMCSIDSTKPPQLNDVISPNSITSPCRIVEGGGTSPNIIQQFMLKDNGLYGINRSIPDNYAQRYIGSM